MENVTPATQDAESLQAVGHDNTASRLETPQANSDENMNGHAVAQQPQSASEDVVVAHPEEIHVAQATAELDLTQEDQHMLEIPLPEKDYSSLSKAELAEKFTLVMKAPEMDFQHRSEEVRAIRESFKNIHSHEREEQRSRQRDHEGDEPLVIQEDPLDKVFSALFKQFDAEKEAFKSERDKARKASADKRSAIITKIKEIVDLLNSGEKTFSLLNQEFDKVHALQDEWKACGAAEASAMRELNNAYRFQLDRFYQIVRINRDLREQDHKKNLQTKTQLCKDAEALIEEASINKAVELYRTFKTKWNETGPVSNEHRDAIWERFQTAGDKIFEKLRELNEKQREKIGSMLAAKTLIVQKLRELTDSIPKQHGAMLKMSEAVEQLFTDWKAVGYMPSDEGDQLWEEFKKLRERFFLEREKYYEESRKVFNENLKLKNALIQEAESLRESNEWKKTAETLKKLQQRWKEIGPVPFKQSEKLWNRFRDACDAFFKLRGEHFAVLDSSNEENLKMKRAIVERLEAFVPGEDQNQNFESLKAFQSEFFAIGHVPIKEKEKINNVFKNLLDKQYGKLKALSGQQRFEVTRNRFEGMLQAPGANSKVADELRLLQDKIRKKETELQTLENNIGFFAKSKSSNPIIKETEQKIRNLKEEIARSRDQLKALRKLIDERKTGGNTQQKTEA